MSMQNALRRLIGGGEGAGDASAAPGSGGAAGLALARAAQRSIGLPLSPRAVTRESFDRARLLDALAPDALLIGLGPAGATTGLAAIEPQLRCAVVEAQVLGAPRAASVSPGAVTGTEAAMMGPFLTPLIDELSRAGLAGLPDCAGLGPGARLTDRRAAGLILPEAQFAILRFEVEIVPGSGREGGLLLALPRAVAKPAPASAAATWKTSLRNSVLQAPAELEAVLHRMRLPAHEIEAMQPGVLLSLPGVDLGAVRLEDTGGRAVATGRLGQRAGLRAVRLSIEEVPPDPPREIPARPAR